ncbi:bifunctional proline dehydrogenase/L-glutamate gamma-semialdehyde dehydrogenase PutA [Methylovirgula sp. HY1]|uniref:bifunctional proline dehydrogenase/L-glutamate gamma-semialdehyde dehydrogenase PutA n=1 Tax=Methylovirgula sp. HY1 TaxID=2822761 RepID=UPI001C5AC427|nr:bifunctional proline dehydrogenase/L-glutamate gamma-semialdehyde dehydrogenase PutA [Methylovirgula sp. HY1]
MTQNLSTPAAFAAPYGGADEDFAARLFADAELTPDAEARIDGLATQLLEKLRAVPHRLGAMEDFLREYALSTEEGLALMVLAEALLRVPDDATADRLIADKLAQPAWAAHATSSDALLVQASAWALGLTARHFAKPGSVTATPAGLVGALARRIGMGTVRHAARQAMQILGAHFILGRTIEDALHRAEHDRSGASHSFDMLGEGARTASDAEAYFASYAHAIEMLGTRAAHLPGSPGISIKLSALHPRFEAISRGRVMRELVPRLGQLIALARATNIAVTIDAEEADRLELTLDVFESVCKTPELAGWTGLGLAVQTYQKRAEAVLDHLFALARRYDRRFSVRLVKGAYWDTEIKRAQERGLADYPVFSRKAMTDLNYLVCAQKLLDAREKILPQFATHNALTVASVIERAGNSEGYEFQRLHGMGTDLYAALHEIRPEIACRIYAPVGTYRDLLAYLVRRLLENGANSSFVAKARDPAISIQDLLRRPQALIATPLAARAPHLPLPEDLHAPKRKLAMGLEFGEARAVEKCLAAIALAAQSMTATPLIDGQEQDGMTRDVTSPIDGAVIGQVVEARPTLVAPAMAAAAAGFRVWSQTNVGARAAALAAMATHLEQEAPCFVSLLQTEGGKTLDDAIAELREAIDYCRYYSVEAQRLFATPQDLPGPTGEDNKLEALGRGVFLCISPWNFPLAIFLGQIAAALVAGNSVIAKPAEQTPLIAAETVRALHRCGVPTSALQLMLGDGTIGAALVEDPRVAGIVFTGSTEVAWHINRALAARDGPIVPFIAETGGINAMIVDATALPEQVTDDVIASAFRSAGQRCSALRLLCLQEDVADQMIAMITGATRELTIGDPRDIATHIGPVIDAAAKQNLESYIAAAKALPRAYYAGQIPASAPQPGFYVAPHIFEIARVADLEREIFGPVLHVLRYRAQDLDNLLDAIEALGYGLTLGIHSRIDSTIAKIAGRHLAGNCYVNRPMIGAVVGTQPFGGFGLSGTGPKAGGPHYLLRFIREQTLTVNTAAAGGNARLMIAEE